MKFPGVGYAHSGLFLPFEIEKIPIRAKRNIFLFLYDTMSLQEVGK